MKQLLTLLLLGLALPTHFIRAEGPIPTDLVWSDRPLFETVFATPRETSMPLVQPVIQAPVTLSKSWSDSFTLGSLADRITLGDARRATADGIAYGWNSSVAGLSHAATWTTDTCKTVASNADYVHRELLVPAWANTCAATQETWNTAKDAAGLTRSAGYQAGKFMYDHPQVTLAAGAIIAFYYLNRAATGVIEKEYLKLDKFVFNTESIVAQYDISDAHINVEKNALMSACDMYIPVTYLRLGGLFYENEITAIDDFFVQVRVLRDYLNRRLDRRLINDQIATVREAARLVQYLLSKKLNFFAAQRILAQR